MRIYLRWKTKLRLFLYPRCILTKIALFISFTFFKNNWEKRGTKERAIKRLATREKQIVEAIPL